jgi:type II secretory pathway pseudopilin PulG
MKHFLSRKSAAFTLAELLIATAITGLIIILLGQIFSSASAMWRVSDQRTDAFRDARAALQLMAAELARANISGDPQMLRLTNIQTSTDGTYTYATEADSVSPSKNLGKSDLCAVEYYLLWDDSTKTYSLMRFFKKSDALTDPNSSTHYLANTSPNFDAIYDKDKSVGSEEVLATPVWDLQIRPGITDPALSSVSGASTSWKWLEIRFKSMSVNAARKLKGMPSIDQSTWTNTNSTEYKNLILPYEQQFVTRISLDQNR